MDQFEFGVVSDFLGDRWAQFIQFMHDEHGMDEAQCEDIANKLDALAGRS